MGADRSCHVVRSCQAVHDGSSTEGRYFVLILLLLVEVMIYVINLCHFCHFKSGSLKDKIMLALRPTLFSTSKYFFKYTLCSAVSSKSKYSFKSKYFLIFCPFKAGILRDKLILALEPEAASIYCSRLPLARLEGVGGLIVFEAGKKYLVLDAGGNLCSRN